MFFHNPFFRFFEDESEGEDFSPDALRKLHQAECTKGDGWSHAFFIYNQDNVELPLYDPGNGESTNVDPKIVTNIRLKDCTGRVIYNFSQKNWDAMASFIKRCTNLKKIFISFDWNMEYEAGTSFIPKGLMAALFREGGRLHDFPSLEEIVFRTIEVDFRREIPILVNFLKAKTTTLKRLMFDHVGLTDNVVRGLAEALNYVKIEKLDLSGNKFRQRGLGSILSSSNACHLVELRLEGMKLDRASFLLLSQFVRERKTMLQRLSISPEVQRDNTYECAKSLINSLRENKTVTKIEFEDNDQIKNVLPEIQNMICNLSSIDAICNSNNIIRDFKPISGTRTDWEYNEIGYCNLDGDPFDNSPIIKQALKINQKPIAMHEKTRQKIWMLYFDGEFDVKSLLDMPPVLLPRVIGMTTTSMIESQNEQEGVHWRNGKLNNTYRLIRNLNLPSIFGFPSPAMQLQQKVDENELLKVDNKELRRENATLLAEMNQMKLEMARLRAEVEELHLKESLLPNKRANRE